MHQRNFAGYTLAQPDLASVATKCDIFFVLILVETFVVVGTLCLVPSLPEHFLVDVCSAGNFADLTHRTSGDSACRQSAECFPQKGPTSKGN